ncbi:hypothetical protein AB0B45_02550 [Nonomuraea sp. NPDC049152]|uniref:hypothetical protein n=1 Tax=Nonomuraea sp. NPDC049152 TaxID=3154350 RepID=UPI0033E05F3F
MSRYHGYRPRRRMSGDTVIVGTLATVSAVILGVGVFAVAAAVEEAQEGETVMADCVDTTTLAADGSYQPVDERFCDGGSHSGYTYVYGGAYSSGRVHGATTIRPSNVGISTRTGRVIVGGFGGRGGGGS